MPQVLRIALLSLAIQLLPMKPAHADLFAAFLNGVPAASPSWATGRVSRPSKKGTTCSSATGTARRSARPAS